MSNVVVDKQKIDILANAIADKSGVPVTMTLDEMKEAVDGIQTGGTPTIESLSVTPSELQQTYNSPLVDGYKPVTVGAIPSSYVGSGVTRRSSSDMTASGATVTAPAGYYASSASKTIPNAVIGSGLYIGSGASLSVSTSNGQLIMSKDDNDGTFIVNVDSDGYIAQGQRTVSTHSVQLRADCNINDSSSMTVSGATVTAPAGYYASAASKTVASGTEGTPTATKGSVSNHAITVTPSVTNTSGYITGGTKTGTGVSVSASELVSGNLAITENGTNIDVTNYSTVSVAVEGGGGGMTVATANTTLASANASISFTGLSGEPTSFVITTASDLATGASPYKTATVVFDGTDLHGQIVTNTSNANASYSTSFTKSYSNGTLTVTGSGTNFRANQYKLIYTYGGNSANIGTAETQVGSGATSITFTGLTDEPDYFSVIFKSNFSTSSGYQRVQSVAYDGTNIYGVAMDSGANAMSAWSYTYSNGSLTVSSSGTNNGGYFHQPGYYQLTYGIGGTVEPVEIEVEPLSVTQNGTYTAPTGTAYSPVTVNVSGGSVNVATTTWTNSDSTATSHTFTGLSGTPKAAFLRCTSSLSRSSSSSNYFIADMRWTGSATAGNSFRRSNGTYANVTSGYSFSASGTSLTVTTSGTSTSNPGSFYNGTYELTYVY